MGVAEDLGYRFPRAGAVRRGLRSLVATRPAAWLAARTVAPLDTLTQRLTGGRHTLAHLVVGLPVLQVTTTGRRSGQPRTSHLVAIPYRDRLALVGTNFGQPATPAWVLNLEADARAAVSYRGRTLAVLARPAGPGEREEVLDAAEGRYVGYRAYRRRITGRSLRVFVLEPAP